MSMPKVPKVLSSHVFKNLLAEKSTISCCAGHSKSAQNYHPLSKTSLEVYISMSTCTVDLAREQNNPDFFISTFLTNDNSLMALVQMHKHCPVISQSCLDDVAQMRLPVVESAGVATNLNRSWSRIEAVAAAAKASIVPTETAVASAEAIIGTTEASVAKSTVTFVLGRSLAADFGMSI